MGPPRALPRVGAEQWTGVLMTIRKTIIEAMARAFWVAAYADACDRYFEEHGEPPAGYDVAGPREDWMDKAPETGGGALRAAFHLVRLFERKHLLSVEDVFEKACALEGHRKDPTPSDFGHYMAMEAMGHGVGWGDDHPGHGYDLPRVEGYTLAFEDGELVEDFTEDWHDLVWRAGRQDEVPAARARDRWVRLTDPVAVLEQAILAHTAEQTTEADYDDAFYEYLRASVRAWEIQQVARCRRMLKELGDAEA